MTERRDYGTEIIFIFVVLVGAIVASSSEVEGLHGAGGGGECGGVEGLSSHFEY